MDDAAKFLRGAGIQVFSKPGPAFSILPTGTFPCKSKPLAGKIRKAMIHQKAQEELPWEIELLVPYIQTARISAHVLPCIIL